MLLIQKSFFCEKKLGTFFECKFSSFYIILVEIKWGAFNKKLLIFGLFSDIPAHGVIMKNNLILNLNQ